MAYVHLDYIARDGRDVTAWGDESNYWMQFAFTHGDLVTGL